MRKWLLLATGALLMGIATVVWHIPSERMLGEADAGTYTYAALALARGEGTAPRAGILERMPGAALTATTELRPPLGLRDQAIHLEKRLFYLNWQVEKRPIAHLVPRFPPGYPAVLALAFRLGGWPALLGTNAVLMLLAGLLAMALTDAWAGEWAALGLAVLWALFPLNLWIGSTTLAEPLTMVLGLGTVVAWVRATKSEGPSWPMAMGLMAGLGPLVKLDAIPWLVVPMAYGMASWRQCGRRAWLPVATTVPTLAVVATILLLAGSSYAAASMGALMRYPAFWLGIVAVILAAGGITGWYLCHLPSASDRTPASAPAVDRPAPRWLQLLCAGIFAAMIGTMAYFWFLRPHWVGSDRFQWQPLGEVIESLREVTLPRLGWYFAPLALGVAMVSAAAAVMWARETWMRVFAGIGVAVLLFVSYDALNFPVEPFVMRRYLPQAIPVLLVTLAGAGKWACGGPGRRLASKRWRSVIAQCAVAAVIAYAIGFSFRVDRRMNAQSDAGGLVHQVQSVASATGPSGVVILRQDEAYLNILAPLLAFGCHRDVLALRIHSDAEAAAVERFLQSEAAAGRSLWLWTKTPGDTIGLPVRSVETGPVNEIAAKILNMSTTEPPDRWNTWIWRFSLRRVEFSDGGSGPASHNQLH